MLEKLSLEEKVGQMFMFGVNDRNTDGIIELIKKYKIGGVILYKRNYSDYNDMLNLIKRLREANKDNKVPLLIAIDEEGGRVNRMPKEFNNLKSIYRFSKLNNQNVIKEYASVISKELSGSGINMNFAPVVDIYNNSNSSVLKWRCFSSDVSLVANSSVTYVKEMQKHDVIPVIKHFPGHGSTKMDTHFLLPYIFDYKEILSKHLYPFEVAIKNGCDAIMVGHIVIRKLTKLLPASISKDFVYEYLRKRYNYDGLVITDDIRMKSLDILYKPIALKKAFSSESDIILFKYRNNDDKIINKVIKMVCDNKIDKDKIDKSVSRILSIKEKYNVSDDISNIGCDIVNINKEIDRINNYIKD